MTNRKQTAKDYLKQLETLEVKISELREEVIKYRELATSTGCMAPQMDKVQTSVAGDKMAATVIKYLDLEKTIEKKIEKYARIRRRIVDEIHSIDAGENTAIFIQILYKRYVERKDFDTITSEVHYARDTVNHKHGEALIVFEKQILKKANKNK